MSDTVTLDEVWKLIRENSEQMKDTDRRMKETSEQMKDTDRRLKELSRQVGNLSSRWGEFVENVVAPGCARVFRERGIPVHVVARRQKAYADDGRTMEVDILVDNTDQVMVVEVKSHLTVRDVQDFMVRLGEFKAFFPRYAGVRVLGAVAGVVSEGKAEEFARNQGLFVIVQSGETIRLDNPPDFVPRSW